MNGISKFSPEERELLAKCEHDLWVEEREDSGWTYYPFKDVKRQRSPYIAPWEQIPADIKKYDYDTTDALIELVSSVGLKVCRREVPRIDSEIRFHTDWKYPLIVSVSGHMSLSKTSEDKLRKYSEKFFKELKSRFPNTDIMLLSGMSEGADRIVVNVAIDQGIDVCPVLPMRIDRYKETFAGYGFKDSSESCQEFDDLLKKSLTPHILNYDHVNEIQAFRELAAYLVSNSHILLAAWDGMACEYRGGTYDAVRMAYAGVDLDLIHSTSPRGSIAVDKDCRTINYLNSNEDTLIYWIKVDRGEVKDRYIPDSDQTVLEMRNCIRSNQSFQEPVYVNSLMRVANSGDRSRIKTDRCISIIENEEVSVSESMPNEYDSMFRKMDDFNKDSLSFEYDVEESYVKDGCNLLEGEGLSSKYRSEGLLKQMACRFGIADNLALKYQRKSRREVAFLTYITVLYTVFFNFMIMFTDSLIFILGYGALYGLAIFFSWNHQRNRNHVKSVEYRSLAETLRIEYYWSILRLSRTTADNSYGYLKNGMSWMRAFMKGATSSFTNDYSKCTNISSNESIEYVEKAWIIRQIEYGREKTERDFKHYNWLSDSNNVLKLVISCLTICSTAMIVLAPDWSKEIIGTLYDPLNVAEINFSAYTIVKLIMIVTINATTILVMGMNRISNSSKAKYKARAMFYYAALSKLETTVLSSNHKNTRKSLGILNELGQQVIVENNDWVTESARHDFKKQRGLLNSLNKIKEKQSRTAELDLELEDDIDYLED